MGWAPRVFKMLENLKKWSKQFPCASRHSMMQIRASSGGQNISRCDDEENLAKVQMP